MPRKRLTSLAVVKDPVPQKTGKRYSPSRIGEFIADPAYWYFRNVLTKRPAFRTNEIFNRGTGVQAYIYARLTGQNVTYSTTTAKNMYADGIDPTTMKLAEFTKFLKSAEQTVAALIDLKDSFELQSGDKVNFAFEQTANFDYPLSDGRTVNIYGRSDIQLCLPNGKVVCLIDLKAGKSATNPKLSWVLQMALYLAKCASDECLPQKDPFGIGSIYLTTVGKLVPLPITSDMVIAALGYATGCLDKMVRLESLSTLDACRLLNPNWESYYWSDLSNAELAEAAAYFNSSFVTCKLPE